MQKRNKMLFMLEKLKSQGKVSATLNIDSVIEALREPTEQNVTCRATPENWEADGGIWQGPED